MNFEEVANYDGYGLYLTGQFTLYLIALVMVRYYE